MFRYFVGFTLLLWIANGIGAIPYQPYGLYIVAIIGYGLILFDWLIELADTAKLRDIIANPFKHQDKEDLI